MTTVEPHHTGATWWTIRQNQMHMEPLDLGTQGLPGEKWNSEVSMYQKVDPSEESDEREKGLEQEDTRTQLARDKGPTRMIKGGPSFSRRW